MKKLFFLLCTAFLCWSLYTYKKGIPTALSKRSFDHALGTRALGRRFVLHRKIDRTLYTKARGLIDQRLDAWKAHKKTAIPKIIHQIWPIDGPIPDELARASIVTRAHHKDFEYKLWTPDMFEKMLTSLLEDEWRELSPQVIRDLAAAAILWQHGGVVVDLETECVQTLSPLLKLADCIIGFEPPLDNRSYQRRLVLSPSLIATEPTQPIIQSWLTEMITRIKRGTKEQKEKHLWICQDALNSVVSKPKQKLGKALFVSPAFFCPISPGHIQGFTQNLDGIKKTSLVRRILQALCIIDPPPFSQISRETIGVHMSGGRESKFSLLANANTESETENQA